MKLLKETESYQTEVESCQTKQGYEIKLLWLCYVEAYSRYNHRRPFENTQIIDIIDVALADV